MKRKRHHPSSRRLSRGLSRGLSSPGPPGTFQWPLPGTFPRTFSVSFQGPYFAPGASRLLPNASPNLPGEVPGNWTLPAAASSKETRGGGRISTSTESMNQPSGDDPLPPYFTSPIDVGIPPNFTTPIDVGSASSRSSARSSHKGRLIGSEQQGDD